MRDARGGSSLADGVLRSPLTWLITAINFGIFLIAWTRGATEGESLSFETLLAYGAVSRPYVQHGEYWRLLSAVFLHLGWIHLLWNTWSMVGWCASIEQTIGSGWFAFAYLTTGIGASAVSVLCHVTLSAGASGAGFGMLAVILALLYRRWGNWNSFIADPLSRRMLINTGAWVLIGFGTFVRMDNYAHLGGFAFGAACGMIVESRRGKRRPFWIASVAAYSLVWAGVVAVACFSRLGLNL